MSCIGTRSFWLVGPGVLLVVDRAMSCYYSPACVGEQCNSQTCSACHNCTDCLDIEYDCTRRSNVKCNCIGVTSCEYSRCEYSASSLVVGHAYDNSYEVKDNCTEFPIIEFGTKSCSVEATYDCGHLSSRNRACDECSVPTAEILDRSCRYHLFRLGGDEFIALWLFQLGYLNRSYVTTDDNTKYACDFDPDNDGFIDFFVELKNRPGCLASLNIDGHDTFMVPIKSNRTEHDRVSGAHQEEK